MRYIECPEVYTGEGKTLFSAGGISDCRDWQKELADKLVDLDFVFINPRRKNFPINDPNASEEQIKWEFGHLQNSEMVSFWFPNETLCPITLYELGRWLNSDKKIFLGIHPEYKRKFDVEIQTGLARPEIEIVNSLEGLANQIRRYLTT
jgi:hypothetical protein